VTDEGRDRWADWLLERRHGGDPEALKQVGSQLAAIRDRVLDRADPAPGGTVLDVGCGDGLIAFGALDRVGPAGTVVFSDISADLLEVCRERAREIGVVDLCEFVRAAADDLSPVGDASVDVVTTRSVLIYVADKAGCFREFARVLRPGGRLSAYEPINAYPAWRDDDTYCGYDVTPVADLAAKLHALYATYQPADSDPMCDFDERDLLRSAERAGFAEIHLDLRADLEPRLPPRRWDGFVDSAPNPLVPTTAEAIAAALTDEEAERFVTHLRPLVENGTGTHRLATAHLWAVKHPV
jgi:arsenite methyltransferase